MDFLIYQGVVGERSVCSEAASRERGGAYRSENVGMSSELAG